MWLLRTNFSIWKISIQWDNSKGSNLGSLFSLCSDNRKQSNCFLFLLQSEACLQQATETSSKFPLLTTKWYALTVWLTAPLTFLGTRSMPAWEFNLRNNNSSKKKKLTWGLSSLGLNTIFWDDLFSPRTSLKKKKNLRKLILNNINKGSYGMDYKYWASSWPWRRCAKSQMPWPIIFHRQFQLILERQNCLQRYLALSDTLLNRQRCWFFNSSSCV